LLAEQQAPEVVVANSEALWSSKLIGRAASFELRKLSGACCVATRLLVVNIHNNHITTITKCPSLDLSFNTNLKFDHFLGKKSLRGLLPFNPMKCFSMHEMANLQNRQYKINNSSR
jgi:hypothetical protein